MNIRSITITCIAADKIQMSQLKVGVILNYVVILLNILVALLYTPYMLRMMGQSEYGLYALVASVISYLTVLDVGLGNAVVRYTAKFRAEGKQTEQYEMFGMFLVLYLVIGIIALLIGTGFYFNIGALFGETMTPLELDRARTMMMLLIFNVAFTFPMSVFGSIITAYERFVFPRVINITRIILNTVVMICLLHLGYKAVAMVVVQTVFNVLTLILNYIYCKKQLDIKLYFGKFKWGLVKEVAIYSFWIILNVIVDRIYWNSGQFVLGAIVGTAAVAIFAVAIQLQHMYMTLATAITAVFLPQVTGMVTRSNDTKEISDLFVRIGRIQYIAISFILSGFIVFGKQFINLWAGEDYTNSYYITLLFFICMLPDLIQNVGIVIMQARNQVKFRAFLGLSMSIVSLCLQIVLTRYYAEIGCAFAIAIMFIIGQGLVINVYYSKKQKLDVIRFWKEILTMSIVPVFMVLLSRYVTDSFCIDSWKYLLISISIFCAIYIPLFIRFSMNGYERNLLIFSWLKIFRNKTIS